MFLRRICAVLPVFFLFCSQAGVAQSFTSSNLPIIIIETPPFTYIPDEPKLLVRMGVIDNGPGVRNNLTDARNGYDGYAGIERRGSSSASFPKSQYGIELRTSAGADTSAALLGLPVEEDWVLFAPYNDKSLMRDVLAYKMGRDLGRYAPRTRYCELVIDGAYQGIYVLIEKIKRDRNRVDISKLETHENSGDDLTGGYILKIDKPTGNFSGGFASRYPPELARQGQKINFLYEYPEYGQITTQQESYIRQFINDFEGVLAGPDYDDPFQGYRAYADIESFVDFLIMNEVSKNVDGYRLSTFVHKARNSDGGKLRMGPIWDFNLGYGNANYCTSGEPEGFVYEFNSVCSDDFWLVPFWWKKLLRDSYFKKALLARWRELRANQFSTANLHAYIDSVATVLNQESQQRNFEKWPVLNSWLWPNLYLANTFQGEVDILKWWVQQRLTWLDTRWDDDFVTSAENAFGVTTVFPNPASIDWTVNLGAPAGRNCSWQLTDARGKTIREEILAEGSSDFIIEGEGLNGGLYFLRLIRANTPVAMIKLVRSSGD